MNMGSMSILVEDVSFPSEGYRLLGRAYRPNKQGRFPAVAICHGYPGDTKNTDLAEELALNGIVALIFFYQGAWGSEGTWRLINLEPSTRDAVEYLRGLPYVDPERVGLVSHSMGAIPLAKRLSLDTTLRTGVLMSPASDLSLWAGEERMNTIIPVFLHMGEGKLRGLDEEQMRADMQVAMEEQNPVKVIKGVGAPLLVLVGSNDEITAPELCRLLYEAANEPKEWVVIEGADHGFSEHRYPLMEAVLGWLKEHL